MSKKIVYIIVGVVVLVGVFYVGVIYGKSQAPKQGQAAQAFGQNSAFGGTRGTRGAGSFGGTTIGQIISKDDTSITVSLMSGGSKIIFLDNSIPISKQTSGTITDLSVGTQVSITGTANSDGSINAQSIQIRPKLPSTTKAPNMVQ